MEIVRATNRLKELVEEIAVARNRLAELRAERESLVDWLRRERTKGDGPHYGVFIQVVHGSGDE